MECIPSLRLLIRSGRWQNFKLMALGKAVIFGMGIAGKKIKKKDNPRKSLQLIC